MEHNERIARLEEKVDGLVETTLSMRADLREVRDVLVGARIGAKMLAAIAALLGGAAGYAVSFFKGP